MSVLSHWPLNWWMASTSGLEKKGAVVISDPLVGVSGAIAGIVGRAAALPFAPPGEKGLVQTLLRRGPQMGMWFWLYVPLQAAITQEFFDPGQKAFSTFYMGAFAGYWMRFFLNPFGRVHEESVRMGSSYLHAARTMKGKGILHFWYTAHPLLANFAYFGMLAVGVEGARRFLERKGAPVDDPLSNAAVCGVAGGAGAAFASTVTYKYSKSRYAGTVIHDSVLLRGLAPTLMKEVPMMAVTFGTFALLQSVLAPHHNPRGGLGY